MMIDARLAGELPVFLPAVTRDGDDDERTGQLLPEPGGNLIAVQAGKGEIEQHMSRLQAAGDLDRLIPIEGDSDVVTEGLQKSGRGLGGVAVVVDDEDAEHG